MIQGIFILTMFLFMPLAQATDPVATELVDCGHAFNGVTRSDFSNFCYSNGGYLWKPRWNNDSDKALTPVEIFSDTFTSVSGVSSLMAGGDVEVTGGYRLPTIKELSVFIGTNNLTSFGRWFYDVLDNSTGGSDYIMSSSYSTSGGMYALNIITQKVETISISASQRVYLLGVSKFVQLKNISSKKCLEVVVTDVSFNETKAEACNPSELKQRWKVYGDGPYVKIKSMHTTNIEHCLEFGNATDNHAKTYDCALATTHDRWLLNNDGSIKKNNASSTGYLTDNGSDVITSSGTDSGSPGPSQKWVLY